jgi:hypothetical protein
VFAILERIVRVQVAGSQTVNTKIAIYRGEDPLTYRIDIYPLSATGQMSGKIALELELQADSQGRISTGELRVLPGCLGGSPQSGCTSSNVNLEVFLLAPVFGGVQSRLASGPGVSIVFAGTAPAPVAVDFDELLSDTTWNQ